MNEERLPISAVLEMIRTRQITAEAGFELIKKLRDDKPSDSSLRESHERRSFKSGETNPGSPPRYTANHTTASGDSRPRCESQDIAVIGISGQFPDAKNVDEFWANLAAGKDSVRTVPESRWNAGMLLDHALPECGIRAGLLPEIDSFDPAFFGISPLARPMVSLSKGSAMAE